MSKEFQENRTGFLKAYLVELRKSFHKRDLSNLSIEQAEALLSMPGRLDLLQKLLRQIEADEVNVAKIVSDVEREEKQREIDERIAQVSHEMFVVACASNIPMEQVLEIRREVELDDRYLNDATKDGLNPLAAALAGGRSEKELDLLIKEGADVNFKTPDGNNAAHFAVMFGVSDKILEHLIKEHKVDINAKNAAGLTPLDMALIKQEEQGKESSLVDVLRKNGAQLGILDGLVKGSVSDEEKAEALVVKKAQELKERTAKKDAAKKDRSRVGERNIDSQLSKTVSISSHNSTELDERKGIATQYLQSMGVEFDEHDDHKTILKKALLAATKNNQPMMTLFLLQSGAVVDQDVAHAAIDTKNMNLICIVIANSTREVMQEAEVYAEKVYAPAAVLIDAAENHGLLTAYTVASPTALVSEQEGKISAVSEQSIAEEKLRTQEKAKLDAANQEEEKRHQQEEIQERMEHDKAEMAAKSSVGLELFEKPTLANAALSEEESFGSILRGIFDAVEEVVFGDQLLAEDEEQEELEGEDIFIDHDVNQQSQEYRPDDRMISQFQEKSGLVADVLRVSEENVNHVLDFIKESGETSTTLDRDELRNLHDKLMHIMSEMEAAGIGSLEHLEQDSISAMRERKEGGIDAVGTKKATPVASH